MLKKKIELLQLLSVNRQLDNNCAEVLKLLRITVCEDLIGFTPANWSVDLFTIETFCVVYIS